MDAATKKAEVSRFLQRYPQTDQAGDEHPALQGCSDIPWSEIPGCPAGIPALFRGLLDPAAAPEAARVLSNTLMSSPFHLSAAMPVALRFLLRLAAEPDIPARSRLLDLLLVVAELSQPVDPEDERAVLLFGADNDHPEREQCRAVLSDHASLLYMLLGDELPPALRDGAVRPS
ncbi:hypothetical protein [Micromonospora sp. HM5-17]|uniref:hypothetical protein n=1 Tax=Micromonospora sp. HM5-17 TaxID=2487710 RepID=UPI0011CDC783|nr:hypothetical protein [Micromonospora sp. HM5-17]